jgi:hypothetical protein
MISIVRYSTVPSQRTLILSWTSIHPATSPELCIILARDCTKPHLPLSIGGQIPNCLTPPCVLSLWFLMMRAGCLEEAWKRGLRFNLLPCELLTVLPANSKLNTHTPARHYSWPKWPTITWMARGTGRGEAK